MAWVRIDDQAPLHPKMLRAGAPACWLWVCGLAYAQSHLTNGFIPDRALSMIGIADGSARVRHLADLLVEARLFERLDGGYQIHDYLVHNEDADTVKQRRDRMTKARREAGQRGGFASGIERNQRSKTEAKSKQSRSKTEANKRSKTEAPSHPIPSHPIQEKKKQPSAVSSEAPAPSEPAFLRFPVVGSPEPEWALSEAQVAEWMRLFPGLDVHGECRKALGWVQASPGRRKTARGMLRFLVGWLSRTVDRGGPRANVEPGQMLGKQTTRLLAAIAQLKDTR